MKKGLKWIIGIVVVLYLFGRVSGNGSSGSDGTRSTQQTTPTKSVQQEELVQQEQPTAEPVMQEQEETEPLQEVQEPEQVQQEGTAAAELQAEEQESAESSIPGVSAEFKNSMDEYEAFFDEYIELMQAVGESNDLAVMGKYAEMMNQYVVTMQALENMDTESMTVAEQAYYIEVMARIEKKLLLASQ